jgi:hypothetical protein
MFFLARELGMTVGHLSRTMTARELAEWVQFYRMESEQRTQDALVRNSQAQAQRGRRGRRTRG